MTFKKRRATKGAQGVATLGDIGKSILKAVPITLLAGFLLLLGATALLMMTKDPAAHHTSAALTALYLSALLGGAVTVRFCHRRAPLFCGIGFGLLLLLLFAPLTLLVPNAVTPLSGTLRLLTKAAVVLAALCGTLLGAKEKKRRRKH